MQLIVRDESIECPVCSLILEKIEHKHQISVTVKHKIAQCPWSGAQFRMNKITGYAERVKVAA
jgi:uncharacterized protein (DUF2225 family)